MSAVVPVVAKVFTTVFAGTAGGSALAGVVGTAVKGAFVGGLISKATGGDFKTGALGGALGGALLGGLGGLGGGVGGSAGGGVVGTSGAVAGGTAGAAGGAFGQSWFGQTLGQALTGGAQAWMSEASRQNEFEQREDAIIDAENRDAARFKGFGQALDQFGDRSQQPGVQAPQMADDRAQDRGVLSAGEEYKQNLQKNNLTKRRQRLRFNPESGRVEEEGMR